jgi:hypothetical protein
MQYRIEAEGYQSPDMTPFAEHITAPYITDVAYQQEPWAVLWCVRNDGVLLGCTYNTEQDVIAWHRHPLVDAFVECVETIPAPSSFRDDLWMIVRYTLAGVTKRYVLLLTEEATDETLQSDWWYVDAGVMQQGSPFTVVTGLGHLEGKTVAVLANGALHPPREVISGQITLQAAATQVIAGMPITAVLQTTEIQHDGRIKRINRAVIQVLRTLSAKAGPDPENVETIRYRPGTTPMGSPPPAYSGMFEIEWPADYDRQQRLTVVQEAPMPVTVVALIV